MTYYLSSFMGESVVYYSALLIVMLSIIVLIVMCIEKHRRMKQAEREAEEMRKMQLQLTVERERYRVATEISNDIVFEYDFSRDLLTLSDKYKQLTGRNNNVEKFNENFSKYVLMLHPSDRGILAEACNQLSEGAESVDVSFRILDADDVFVWFQFIAKPIFDENTKLQRVIGRLTNVDMYKKEFERLQIMAQQDPLTGALNKIATKAMIDKMIFRKLRNVHMLMFIDVDQFKKTNDTHGHNVGDKVLLEIVSRVRNAVRTDDIIGRIGGDEFIIYLNGLDNETIADERIKEIRNLLNFDYELEDCNISVSASVGMALYPRDGRNYNELMICADHDMYREKEWKKNNISFIRA